MPRMGSTMEDLSKLWGKFSLLEEESVGVEIKKDAVEELVIADQGQSMSCGKVACRSGSKQVDNKNPYGEGMEDNGFCIFSSFG
jgi:hypothetical protein